MCGTKTRKPINDVGCISMALNIRLPMCSNHSASMATVGCAMCSFELIGYDIISQVLMLGAVTLCRSYNH